MSKWFEKKLLKHEMIVPEKGQIEEQPKKEENEIKFSAPVYSRSMIAKEATVNKSAKLKSDIRYLWSKFVIDSGGFDNAVRNCYQDLENLNKQGRYCDVSGVNFTNPAQAVSQVVNNIKDKQAEFKEQQKSEAEQQTVPQSAPAPESKPE